MSFNGLHSFVRFSKNIFSGQDCQTVNVDLKNEVLNKYEYLQGDYQLSTAINEKPSWKNGAYAIWYVPSEYGKWIIGSLDRIGEDFSWISTGPHGDDESLTNVFNSWNFWNGNDESLTNVFNSWNFWNGSSFIRPSEPKAIQITCNGKYSKLF